MANLNLGIEQIIIGAVCLLVLLAVGIALFRGKGRRRVPEQASSAQERPAAGLDRAAPLKPPSLTPRTRDERQLGPSLGAGPSTPDPTPDPGAVERKVDELVRAQTEVAQALKFLKGEFDTIRQSHKQMERRLAEAERLLAESPEVTAEETGTSTVTPLHAAQGGQGQAPVRPIGAAPARDEAKEDPSLARVREAVEMLKREDRD